MSRPDIYNPYAMLALMTTAIDTLNEIKDSAKGFAGLMSLYEQNYIRFKQLVDENNLENTAVSIKQGDINLHLQQLECCRYTTTYLLSYQLHDESGDIVKTPDLKIRIYHDAQQAEVLSCCRHDHKSYAWIARSACQSTLQWRWRMNYLLHKWLNHCLKMGHHFPQQKHGISWDKMLISLQEV